MIDNHDLILVQNRVKESQYLMILEVKNYMCSTLPSVLSVNLVQRFFFRQIKITSKVAYMIHSRFLFVIHNYFAYFAEASERCHWT